MNSVRSIKHSRLAALKTHTEQMYLPLYMEG